jgi:sarcosine oxidase gamma subunit
MDEVVRQLAAIEATGLRVRGEVAIRAASLRYFDSQGSFAASVAAVLGVPLPGVLQATRVPASSGKPETLLAWRSPTETLVLSTDGAGFSKLGVALASAPDGCFVDQSGGLWVLRVSGARLIDLLTRLGGTGSVPQLGEARRGRLADVAVMALCVQAGEVLLVVDRVYADHLLGWIRETAADFR